ncbi:MAG: molybdopterin-binding protein, partial [Thermodesulfovibrionales bacterium]
MSIFLENTPVQVALDAWIAAVEKIMVSHNLTERVPSTSCIDRVTAEPVFAKISSPFYHCSAMDGYAVNFPDTFGASETSPVRLEIPGRAFYLNTGDPLPDGFNAVIKIEDVNEVEDHASGSGIRWVEIVSPAVPWQNVRIIGEDIVAGELIVPANHVVRPIDLAAVLAGGVESVLVKRRASVAVIPTGDEIVSPGVPLKTGDIIDTNSWMISGLLSECHAVSRQFAAVPDRKSLIEATLVDAAAHSDMVLVIAGSSLGTEDFTASVIRATGQVVVHGVNIKPGKPVILGIVGGTPVVGVPGYPVSAFLAFKLFVRPVLTRFFGTGVETAERLHVQLARQVSSPIGIEEFVRLKLGQVSGRTMATPVGRGAG